MMTRNVTIVHKVHCGTWTVRSCASVLTPPEVLVKAVEHFEQFLVNEVTEAAWCRTRYVCSQADFPPDWGRLRIAQWYLITSAGKRSGRSVTDIHRNYSTD